MMRVKTFNSLTRTLALVALVTLGWLSPLQALRAQDGPQPRLQTIELTAGAQLLFI